MNNCQIEVSKGIAIKQLISKAVTISYQELKSVTIWSPVSIHYFSDIHFLKNQYNDLSQKSIENMKN